MTILAKAIEGKEYLYSARSAHAVSKASAEKIRDALNGSRYNLKDGEVWHLYTVDQYDTAFDYAQFQRFTVRKGNIYRRG